MYSKPAVLGLAAALGLVGFYWILMTLLSGPDAAWEQLKALWPYMLPLAGGFGIQVGLFSLIKQTIKTKSSLAAGGTSAGVGMLACCAHHGADVLPLIGFSALSIFLLKYQIPVLILSLIINLSGVLYMLTQIRKIHID